jgi:hypothetical protein
MPHVWVRAVIPVAIVLFSTLTADAQVVTFNFTGTISYVPVELSGGPIAPGQTFSGSFTFDATATDEDPSPVVGLYQNLIAFEVSIPGAAYEATASPGLGPGSIEILDDEEGARDRYVADMQTPGQNLIGTAVSIGTLERLAIVLRDSVTHSAFSSDALPIVPPSLSDFPTGTALFLGFSTALGGLEIGGTLASLTAAQVSVPERIEMLVEHVDALEIGETIDSGQANSLRQKLQQALARVANAQNKPAANVLMAFAHQIQAYVRSGRLANEEGEVLLSAAADVIAELAAAQ